MTTDVKLEGEAEKIWNEIKHIQLDLFSLPDQTIEKVCKPLPIDTTRLYVLAGVGAVFAALDAALNADFDLELVGKWYTIARKAK